MENIITKTIAFYLPIMIAAGCSQEDHKKTADPAPNSVVTMPNIDATKKIPSAEASPVMTGPDKPASDNANLSLVGNFKTVDMNSIDLQMDGGRPTVLIFAQDSCAICAKETKTFISSLKKPHQIPPKVNIYTVLIGANQDDAHDWVNAYQPPWKVGYDENLALFQQYFTRGTKVPAIVVHDPKRGILLKKIGETTASELQNLTGPWED